VKKSPPNIGEEPEIFHAVKEFELMGTQDNVENLCEKLGLVLDRDFSNLRCRKFAKTI